MSGRLVLVESNTTGTGRTFARRARELGVEPVMICTHPRKYAWLEQDRVACIRADTTDSAAVLAAAQSDGAGVAGVTSSSEYFVGTAAAVAAKLGLPGPSPDAIAVCRDKYTQRLALSAARVAVPGFALAHNTSQVVAAATDLGLPVVIKPRRGSGSKGVRCCPTTETAGAHARVLFDQEPDGVLVESMLAGPEFSLEVVGEQVVAVVAKHLGPHPDFVEVGHDLPATVTPQVDADLRACTVAAVRALGLGWGAAHVEVKHDGSRAYVVEVNPRLAGGMIPELVRQATGTDLVRAQVLAALGRPADLTPRSHRAASIRFLVAAAAGTMGELSEPTDDARATPGVIDVALYAQPCRRVAPPADFRGRLGHVIAAADDPVAARKAAVDAVRSLGRGIRYDRQEVS